MIYFVLILAYSCLLHVATTESNERMNARSRDCSNWMEASYNLILAQLENWSISMALAIYIHIECDP